MLEHGADFNLQDKDGRTGLLKASFQGHLEVCQLLLSRGADPDLTDKHGVSPLMVASEGNHTGTSKMVACLLMTLNAIKLRHD